MWHLAQEIRADASASQILQKTPLNQVTRDYLAGTLPATLQKGLTQFLRTYGHRSVAEIDAGLPRWSEDPTHILSVLVNYLLFEKPDLTPDVQFERGARDAEAMLVELTKRALKQHSWLYSRLVLYLLSQVRELGDSANCQNTTGS